MPSIHLETVDESILLPRVEESGFTGDVGKDEDTGDGDPDSGNAFDQAIEKRQSQVE